MAEQPQVVRSDLAVIIQDADDLRREVPHMLTRAIEDVVAFVEDGKLAADWGTFTLKMGAAPQDYPRRRDLFLIRTTVRATKAVEQ